MEIYFEFTLNIVSPFCLYFELKHTAELAMEILYWSFLTLHRRRACYCCSELRNSPIRPQHLFFITVQNNTVLCCPCNFDRWLIINLRYCGSDRNLIGYLWTKCESAECRSMLWCHFDISFQRLNPLFWNIWIHTVCFSLVDVYVSRQKHNLASHEVIKLYQ